MSDSKTLSPIEEITTLRMIREDSNIDTRVCGEEILNWPNIKITNGHVKGKVIKQLQKLGSQKISQMLFVKILKDTPPQQIVRVLEWFETVDPKLRVFTCSFLTSAIAFLIIKNEQNNKKNIWQVRQDSFFEKNFSISFKIDTQIKGCEKLLLDWCNEKIKDFVTLASSHSSVSSIASAAWLSSIITEAHRIGVDQELREILPKALLDKNQQQRVLLLAKSIIRTNSLVHNFINEHEKENSAPAPSDIKELSNVINLFYSYGQKFYTFGNISSLTREQKQDILYALVDCDMALSYFFTSSSVAYEEKVDIIKIAAADNKEKLWILFKSITNKVFKNESSIDLSAQLVCEILTLVHTQANFYDYKSKFLSYIKETQMQENAVIKNVLSHIQTLEQKNLITKSLDSSFAPPSVNASLAPKKYKL